MCVKSVSNFLLIRNQYIKFKCSFVFIILLTVSDLLYILLNTDSFKSRSLLTTGVVKINGYYRQDEI